MEDSSLSRILAEKKRTISLLLGYIKKNKEYTSQSLSFKRRAVRVSAFVKRQRNTIHSFTEVDIKEPRRLNSEAQALQSGRLKVSQEIRGSGESPDSSRERLSVLPTRTSEWRRLTERLQ